MAELTISHLTEAVQIEGIKSEKRDEKQIKELASLNKSFAQYFKSMAADSLDKLEEKREKVSGKKPTGDEFDAGVKGFKDAAGMGLMGFLGAIGAALTGLAVGLTIGFGKYLVALGTMFDSMVGGKLSTGFKTVSTALRTGLFKLVGLTPDGKFGPNLTKLMGMKSNVILRIRTTMSGISRSIYAMVGLGVDGKPVVGTSNFMKRMYKIGNMFRSGLTNIGNMFRPLTNLIGGDSKAVGGIFSRIGSGIKSFLGAFKIFGGTFSALKGALSPVFTIFKSLGRVIFAPLTLIMGIIDGIKGAISGFAEEGILGGILGAVGGVLGGLIGMPLDLLKSAVSWIAGKLGFENFSEILDSFSFKDGIMDLFMGIASVFNGAIDWVKNAIGGVASKIASFFGFGGDEEEPEVKEIKRGRVKPQVEKDVVKPTPQPKVMVQDDDFHEMRGTDEDGFDYKETKRAPKSEQDIMAATEERYKRHLKINQDRMSTYNEQGRGDSKGAKFAEERVMKLQTALEELQAKRQSMGAPIIANETVNNSTSSSSATYGDTSPATDDLDRVA